MKKIFTVFVIILLTITCFTLQVFAMEPIDTNETVMSVDEVICLNYAMNYVEAYYQNIYGTSEITDYFEYDLTPETELLAEYMKEVWLYKNSQKKISGYTDYSGEFKLYDIKTIDGIIYIDLSCKINFRYPQVKSMSMISTYKFFAFKKDVNGYWVLHDIYEPEDDPLYYERIHAGSLDDYINFVPPITSNHIKAIKEEQTYLEYQLTVGLQEMVKKAEEESKILVQQEKTETKKQNSTSNNTKAVSINSYSLNKGNITTYAMFNFDGDPPESGNILYTPYVNMWHSGGDCTNFISHCILAGGATPNTNTSNGWYCNGSTWSASWSYVIDLYNFIVGNDGITGPYGHSATISLNSMPEYDIADILQINHNTTSAAWDHSTLIVGFTTYNQNGVYYQYVPLLAYRSDTRLGAYNISFIEEYFLKSRYGGARAIILDGYYREY